MTGSTRAAARPDGPAPDRAGTAVPDQAGTPAPDQAGTPAPDRAGTAAVPDRAGARAPGRPRSAEAEKAILDATVEMLVARGLSGLSVEAVAARAGVAKTTIYRRWPDKKELVLAAVTAAKGPPPEPPGRSVRGDLLHLLRGVGRDRDGSPDNWSALMSRLSIESEAYPDLVLEAWRRAVGPRRAVFARVLARGVEEGLIRPDADPDLVADMLIAPVVGKIRPARPPLTEAQVATVVDTILRGLTP
ncbi:MAG TPA: TetR/AcrR family transcriptional regulator [Mycobacteriales bacterium]